MKRGRRRRTSEPGSERDHISSLPDELLHGILCRLGSAAAAARTGVLSRRWRGVWASLPELVLGDDLIHHGASFLDAVDDALAAYSAPHVHGLEIAVPHDAPARRVASWLGFASRRLAGALYLRVRPPDPDLTDQWESWHARGEGDELELPPCEGATSIKFRLGLGSRFLLRLPLPPPAGGMFTALTDLEIILATVEGRALEALVSTQCPRLRKLSLWAITLVATSDVSVRSGTLRHLDFQVRDTLRLHVAAPALQVLGVESPANDVYVSAPNLAELVWGSECARFVLADVGRHLRRLEVKRCDAMAPLMRRFNSVDHLRLRLDFPSSKRGMLDDTNFSIPKCQTLSLYSVVGNSHDIAPTVLHVLRRTNGIRKLDVLYAPYYLSEMCKLTCLCRLPKSTSMTDNIILDSREEIEIVLFLGSAYEFVEFLKQVIFNIWSNTKLKSVYTNLLHSDPSLLSEVCKKIYAMCPPNIRIKSYVFRGEGRARFETGPI